MCPGRLAIQKIVNQVNFFTRSFYRLSKMKYVICQKIKLRTTFLIFFRRHFTDNPMNEDFINSEEVGQSRNAVYEWFQW